MLKKLFSRKKNPAKLQAITLKANEHPIDHRDISRGALNVIDTLEKGNHEAYLVGGGVRDLLVGGKPKDFDIATNATPEQVKRLFRNARIIGRRFRIVHVRMGREIIEVTTFRSHHEKGNDKQAASSEKGMLIRDNVYGDIHSDAIRRDFTMNALYYSPSQEAITDFTSGVSDIEQQLVRMIGDPDTRYQEDPVRTLRAVRLAAKLGFDIEEKTAEGILNNGHLLANIPPARLFDESLKLFMGGYAAATYQELRRYTLFQFLFPATEECFGHNEAFADALIYQAALNTDKRIHNSQRVTPAFIFAVILWPAVEDQLTLAHSNGVPAIPAMHQAAQWVISRQVQRVAIPKRFTLTIRDIWELQIRLPKRHGNQAYRSLAHPKFRAAYDFLLLREQAGEELGGLGQWWTEFQEADENQQQSMIDQLEDSKSHSKKRRRPRRKKPASEA
ncbi:MAG: polynucleotide adenylyltransferase PcnB [Cellvibrionaceae bacterium]